ncbi:MAG: NAD-dependent epimerase/dehydratase family protein [Limnochordia bacterium]
MKSVLITGANSYVGTNVEKWLAKHPDRYHVDTISVKGDAWREHDFSVYDVVFHVAGIAHVSSDPKMKELYYSVNRDLAIQTAEKAKAEGVKQFIFMSSIIVYGRQDSNDGFIDRNTVPKPDNFYGDSKLQAEKGLQSMDSSEFKVVILRPPMIYGKGCKGNYPRLAKLARMLPVFPDYENRRSMLHIDNLCEFIRFMIDNEESGLFFPQNKEYVKTSEMVRLIAETHGRRIRLVRLLNPPLSVLCERITIANKIFGDLVYCLNISKYAKGMYQIRNLRESIELTEGRNTSP